MSYRAVRPDVRVLLAGLLAAISLAAEPQYQRADSERLLQKVAGISEFANQTSVKSLRTTITETELNAYFAYDGKALLPAGVVEPVVSILGRERVSARAVVDLDAVRKQKNPTSALDPTSYLSGRLPVTVNGVLKTGNGIGRFELESATVGGVPVPKMVLQQIVSVYSRTPDNPSGINLDDPFVLPAKIREIQVQPRQTIIVQ
jgi:hypothetical protein